MHEEEAKLYKVCLSGAAEARVLLHANAARLGRKFKKVDSMATPFLLSETKAGKVYFLTPDFSRSSLP
jgi:hypothetical protein